MYFLIPLRFYFKMKKVLHIPPSSCSHTYSAQNMLSSAFTFFLNYGWILILLQIPLMKVLGTWDSHFDTPNFLHNTLQLCYGYFYLHHFIQRIFLKEKHFCAKMWWINGMIIHQRKKNYYNCVRLPLHYRYIHTPTL